MLVRVDPIRCLDGFYILQLIHRATENDDGHEEEGAAEPYVVYSRYGRTGTKGLVSQEHFTEETDAVQRFQTLFRLQTALQWTHRS
jgi:predicted DNA-binding WGR domain protein